MLSSETLSDRRKAENRVSCQNCGRSESKDLKIFQQILFGNALAKNYKYECIRIIEQFFDSDEMKVVRLTPVLFEQALELYRLYKDKAWGLTDCISFVVMRNEGITKALTFDRHFVQAGFQALMREFAEP